MGLDTHSFVASTNLRAGVYEEETKELTITFRDGRAWQYEGVPPDVWQGLRSAPSAGRYLNQRIKDVYPGSEV
jgi:KTSC domain